MDPGTSYGQAELESRTQNQVDVLQGEKTKLIQPKYLKDPNLERLKKVLVDWINGTLKPEHIVVQSLEEDLYDGLILHHLLDRLTRVRLFVEEIAVTTAAQLRKLEIILEALNESLGMQDEASRKWSVKLIHSKDLLATLHLLVAMVKRFQPELELPSNVFVEVLNLQVDKSGFKSETHLEYVTEQRDNAEDTNDSKSGDPIDQLLKLDSHKINTVKKAILHFVNKIISPLGVEVTDMERQFADGVILILLVGQVEGYFVPLFDFHLTPTNNSEMVQNVTLALDLLNDREVHVSNVDPQDIVSQDPTATLKVLYALFKKHKG